MATKAFHTITLLTTMMWVLSSCGPDVVIDQSKPLPSQAWDMQDTLGFPFQITDTNQAYDMYISLRHTNDYAYRNLFLFVDTHFPGGMISRDTLEFILAHPDGKWLGKGFSKLKYNQFLIRKGVYFPEKGDYHFVFQHAMRVETLHGLRDLGVKISPSDALRP